MTSIYVSIHAVISLFRIFPKTRLDRTKSVDIVSKVGFMKYEIYGSTGMKIDEIIAGMEKTRELSAQLCELRQKRSEMIKRTSELKAQYEAAAERTKKLKRSLFKKKDADAAKMQELALLGRYNEQKYAERQVWDKIDLVSAQFREYKDATYENLLKRTDEVLSVLKKRGMIDAARLMKQKQALLDTERTTRRCTGYMSFILDELHEALAIYDKDDIEPAVIDVRADRNKAYYNNRSVYVKIIERINGIISVYTRKYNLMVDELSGIEEFIPDSCGLLRGLSRKDELFQMSAFRYYDPELFHILVTREYDDMSAIFRELKQFKDYLYEQIVELCRRAGALERELGV